LRIKTPIVSVCAKCKAPALPHRMCENCGTYRGRVVVDVLAKLTKKERKLKERELTAQEATKQEQGAASPLSVEELSKK
jgi:hypothetical protein